MRKIVIAMLIISGVFLVLGIIDANRIASESNQKRYKPEISEISVEGYKTINNASKSDIGDSVKPVVMEIVTVTETPEPTPYPDFDLEHLSIVRQEVVENEEDNEYRVAGTGDFSDEYSEDPAEYRDRAVEDSGCVDGGEGYYEPVPELVEPGSNNRNEDGEGVDGGGSISSDVGEIYESTLTYLGDWTITAYCPCEICCGAYSSGYTASGTLATAGRTIACNELPFGTQVMIDGCIYTVEDTGWSPYDNWIDIYFDSHDEALAYGMQMKEVYLIG